LKIVDFQPIAIEGAKACSQSGKRSLLENFTLHAVHGIDAKGLY
jgi:hypothetical protein